MMLQEVSKIWRATSVRCLGRIQTSSDIIRTVELCFLQFPWAYLMEQFVICLAGQQLAFEVEHAQRKLKTYLSIEWMTSAIRCCSVSVNFLPFTSVSSVYKCILRIWLKW